MITLSRFMEQIISLIALGLLFSCSEKKDFTPPQTEEDSPVTAEVERYRSNRILIKNGLQIQCWLATDNFELAGKAGQPAYVMLPSDWEKTGFTAPTFYGPPLINPSFFEHFPNSQWSIAKAPYGDHLKKGPTRNEKMNGFLSAEQLKHLDQLISMCFGDEEEFSETNMYYLKDWYDISRIHYPDVLVHNNQYPGLWQTSNLRKYVRVAKPDLVTYDWYYFHTSDKDNYIGARDMAGHLKTYRDVALDGISGTGNDYIAFGQYIQGFVNQGTYKLTESQLRLYYYLTLTFGGKWLNWFRYLQGDGYGGVTTPTEWSLLFENGMPGKPTIHMQWANQCNKECMYLSDYIVRLKTTDIRYIAGTSKYTEGIPSNVDSFNPASSCIKNIYGRFLQEGVETEDGADLYLGFFDIIPQEEQGDPSFFKNKNTSFFMITNGMASKLVQNAEPLTQMITVTIDASEHKDRKLFWINMETGDKEELIAAENNEKGLVYKFPLKGGSGTLFMLE